MILLQLFTVILFIYIGMKVGGIGVGFAGGAGVIFLGLLGATPGELPMLVIVFIMVVIISISAMQEAGGIDYLVDVTERLLRKNPRLLFLTAPLSTYILTLMASTGQVSFACMPVIVEVAKDNNIKPTRALAISVVGSLLGIVASPISAAVIFLSNSLETAKTGWGYIELIAISIPATLFAMVITSLFYMYWDAFFKKDTLYDPKIVELENAERAKVSSLKSSTTRILKPGAKSSVIIFIIGLICVLFYAIITSPKLGLFTHPIMTGSHARISVMMAVALSIVIFCKVNVYNISNTSVFKTGMTACICILGVAWLGTTFMDNHTEWLQSVAGKSLLNYPWLLAIVVMVISSFLYSQAASTKILFPTAIAMGIAPATIIACFPATAALFILPNYPTLLAAVELDKTGSTKLGRHIIDHPFLLPGLMATGLAILLSFLFASFIS